MLRGPLLQAERGRVLERRLHGRRPAARARGQYWTGDRELSPFWSWLAGFRFVWTDEPEHGRILGLLESFKFVGSASVTSFSYDQYTLGGLPVSDARAYVGTVSLVAAF
jgi:hypothetical protein